MICLRDQRNVLVDVLQTNTTNRQLEI